MPARKKTERGSNLGDAREVRRLKAAVDANDGSADDDRADPDFQPEEPPSPPAGATTPCDAGMVPEPAEPGEVHAAVRRAAASAGGARETRRLDDHAARERRRGRRKKEVDEMPSIRDALDGTLLAKKVAQELEPVDAWAAPVVAEAAPVATSADGERLVVLGAVAAVAEGEPGATGQLEAHETGPAPPRRGRPPGGTTPKSAEEAYPSHRGVRPGGVANPTASKDERRELRMRGAKTPREYALAAAGGAPGQPPAKRRADAGQERWFRISWQYVGEYRKGSECAEIVRAMADLRSKRHRDMGVRRAVPVEAAMEAAALEGLRRCRVVRAASWPEGEP